jgi:hypothetical protein
MEIGAAIRRSKSDPPLSRTLVRMIGREFVTDDSAARRELGYVGRVSRVEGPSSIRRDEGQYLKGLLCTGSRTGSEILSAAKLCNEIGFDLATLFTSTTRIGRIATRREPATLVSCDRLRYAPGLIFLPHIGRSLDARQKANSHRTCFSLTRAKTRFDATRGQGSAEDCAAQLMWLFRGL